MSALIKHKPVTPGRRGYISINKKELHKGSPYPSLVLSKKNTSGRNNKGRITIWHRGGGHKRKYRIIDWKRDKNNISAIVERIEYDPNRSPFIALLLYPDGERRYIVCPSDLKVGDYVNSGDNASISVGNSLPLYKIPAGSFVHCVELYPGKGAQLVRSAGSSAQFLSIDGDYVILKLRSGELRKILSACRATIGEVSNSEHNLIKIGKAGRKRWMNIRPTVRGVAMNPVDHPLGGGEGKTSGGRHPCTPWGKLDGKKTRKLKNRSNVFIVKRRNKK